MKESEISRRGFLRESSASGLLLLGGTAFPEAAVAVPGAQTAEKKPPASPGVSGRDILKFRVLYDSSRLPRAAQDVLVHAHGGFAVDRRPGKGETYFFLPGAGLLQISSDLETIRLLDTPAPMKNVNLHDTAIWYGPNGQAYLVFPANDAGKIFTVTLDGQLVNELPAPGPDHEFEVPEVGDYFLGDGNFAPTGVTCLDGVYYISTGYSKLDYVLTVRVSEDNPPKVVWNDMAFGGKGDGDSQFQNGHAIAARWDAGQVEVTDRPHAEIKRFSRYGRLLSRLKLPAGSLPCSIDRVGEYALVPALDGPVSAHGAPLYILHHDELVSTILPQADLGLANFKHNHKAVLHKRGDKLCIIVQAWNPGDFAILEQV